MTAKSLQQLNRERKQEQEREKHVVRDSTNAFENAFKKKIFTKERANEEDYIMYMESSATHDYFKSKLTKTRWTVER